MELINQKLGVDNREKITTGQVIKALILNGLGMVSRPLYLFSQFFEDKQDLRNGTNCSGNLLRKTNLYTIYSGTA